MATPRQDKKVDPKHKTTVLSRWNVLAEGPKHVTLSVQGHLDSFGTIKPESLRDAVRSYINKEVVFQDPQTSRLYMNKAGFTDSYGFMTAEGRSKLDEHQEAGRKVALYTMPKGAASAARPAPKPAAAPKTVVKKAEAPARSAKVQKTVIRKTPGAARQDRPQKTVVPKAPKVAKEPKVKVKGKVSATLGPYTALKKLVLNAKTTEGVRRDAFRKMRSLSGHLPYTYRDAERDWIKAHTAKYDPKQPVVRGRTRFGAGERYEPGKYALSRGQYVSGSNTVRYESRTRLEQRARAEARRGEIQRAREAKAASAGRRRMLKAASSITAPKSFAKKAVAAEKARARRKLQSALKFGRENRAFARAVQRLKGYGNMPLHFAVKRTKLAAKARTLGKNLPRHIRYPSAGYGSKTPMGAPVGMRALSGLQTLSAAPGVSAVAGSDIYSTTKTLPTRFYGGVGRGVFFRIDASAVLATLTVRFPEAIRQAAVVAGTAVGRKLLDVVEPYVPKDTGLLYTTAETNVSRTAAGLVDIEGGEAYPSSQMFGVSISYNAPYAELVYFDETKRHGEEYNAHYGTSEKGEKETARWIEAAFEKEQAAIGSLMGEYATAITAAMNAVGGRQVGRMSKR